MYQNYMIKLTRASLGCSSEFYYKFDEIIKSCRTRYFSMVRITHQQQNQSKSPRNGTNSRILRSTSSQESFALYTSNRRANFSSNLGTNKMKVYPIRALQDNYMYLLVDESTKQAAAVDPANASAMASAVADHDVDLKCILTTHHHYDHAKGNSEMVTMFPEIAVYGGGQNVRAVTKAVSHGETIKLGNLTIECLSTPCHTREHICYYVHNEDELSSSSANQAGQTNVASTFKQQQQQQQLQHVSSSQPPSSQPLATSQTASSPIERIVFTGDTLFIAGCGRFFEGSSEEMEHNLNTVLGGLPDDTRVFCGHEYTVQNLKFALTVEPQNKDVKMKLDWAQDKVARHEPTVPSTIGEEKRINPFMRLNKQQVKMFTKEQNEIEVMSVLRQKKNEFVA